MATLTLDQQITAAAEAYKSGQVPTRAALAKVKRLVKLKVLSGELQRSLDADNDAVASCP